MLLKESKGCYQHITGTHDQIWGVGVRESFLEEVTF